MSHVVVAIGEKWDTWPFKNYIYCIARCFVHYFAFSGAFSTKGTPVSTVPIGTTISLFRLFCLLTHLSLHESIQLKLLVTNCSRFEKYVSSISLTHFYWSIVICGCSLFTALYLSKILLDTGEGCYVCLKRCHVLSLPLVRNEILDHTKITFIVEPSATFIILHFQELLTQQELQLALYQQELLQVCSTCFVCIFTFYCMNQFSWNCLLPTARAENSSLAPFYWNIVIELSSYVVAVYSTRQISPEYRWIRAKDASFVSDFVTFCRCHWCKIRYLNIQKLHLLFSPLLYLIFCFLSSCYWQRNSS